MYRYMYMYTYADTRKHHRIPTESTPGQSKTLNWENQLRKQCDRQKHKTNTHCIDPWTNQKHSTDKTIYASNVKYVSARAHHNAKCQLHTKEKEVRWEVVVCFDYLNHPKSNKTCLCIHESTIMQIKFLNNLSPPHEEAGGEVGKWCCANTLTMTDGCGEHPYRMCEGDLCHPSKLGHHYTRPYTNKHKPEIYITQKLTLSLHVQLVHANDQAWHPPLPNTTIASIINTNEWCQWSHTNCVDVTTCMAWYNKVVDIPYQHNITPPDIYHLQPPASHPSPTPMNGVGEATQIVRM